MYYPQIVNDWLNYLIRKYKLPRITPHHFRHSHASLLLQAGVPIKEVSQHFGHKDIKITLEVYSHVMSKEAEKQLLSLQILSFFRRRGFQSDKSDKNILFQHCRKGS